MAVNTWKLLAAAGALTLAASGGCGGDGGGGGEGNGGGNGSNNSETTEPIEVPTASLSDNQSGKECESGSDCDGEMARCDTAVGGIPVFGLSIAAAEAPGGYCSGDCLSNDDCGEGGACIGALELRDLLGVDAVGECQKTCSSDGDCRDGYECLDASLLADLVEVADPATAEAFRQIPKTCLPTPPVNVLDANLAGKECTSNDDCGDGRCQIAFLASSGYCTGSCFQDSDCGSGGICSGGFKSQLGSVAGTCLKSCSTDDDCTTLNHICREIATGKACQAPSFFEQLLGDGGIGSLFGDGGFSFGPSDAGAGGSTGGDSTGDDSTGGDSTETTDSTGGDDMDAGVDP